MRGLIGNLAVAMLGGLTQSSNISYNQGPKGVKRNQASTTGWRRSHPSPYHGKGKSIVSVNTSSGQRKMLLKNALKKGLIFKED